MSRALARKELCGRLWPSRAPAMTVRDVAAPRARRPPDRARARRRSTGVARRSTCTSSRPRPCHTRPRVEPRLQPIAAVTYPMTCAPARPWGWPTLSTRRDAPRDVRSRSARVRQVRERQCASAMGGASRCARREAPDDARTHAAATVAKVAKHLPHARARRGCTKLRFAAMHPTASRLAPTPAGVEAGSFGLPPRRTR